MKGMDRRKEISYVFQQLLHFNRLGVRQMTPPDSTGASMINWRSVGELYNRKRANICTGTHPDPGRMCSNPC